MLLFNDTNLKYKLRYGDGKVCTTYIIYISIHIYIYVGSQMKI